MKSVRPWLVILISVLVGAAAVYLAAQWVGQQAAVATRKVVVATRDIDVGTRLSSEMLQVVDWPAGASLKEPYESPDKVKDRVTNTQVLRGEPILSAKLAPEGTQAGLSAVLPEGHRAITVKVNEIVGVAGFALPGNYVDVMVNTPDENNKPISKIVLERIKVLAVAQDLNTGENKPRVVSAVTLDVTPQQAEQLDLARSIGSLSLVLRSITDKSPAATVGARKTDLLKPSAGPLDATAAVAPGSAASAPAPAPKPAVRKAPAARPVAAASKPATPAVEVIRGIKRSEETPALNGEAVAP